MHSAADNPAAEDDRRRLSEAYSRVRLRSEEICSPLATDDYQIQSIVETSPPKWHLAHVTWFFETFVLQPFVPGYRVFHPRFHYLFNSYYQTLGSMQPRPRRGLLSRPTVEEVYRYRAYVDEQMQTCLNGVDEAAWAEVRSRLTLGLHHEQQHQELLLMDLKHNFWVNPLRPAYAERAPSAPIAEEAPLTWLERPGGIFDIGHGGEGFAFDNETPRHPVLLRAHRLGSRLVTNAEYLGFVEDDGYRRADLWLADGWARVQQDCWDAPLYWHREEGAWREFTLWGDRPLLPQAPVAHLSYYEADAFARWAGKRLPLEAELETCLAELPVTGWTAARCTRPPATGSGTVTCGNGPKARTLRTPAFGPCKAVSASTTASSCATR